MPATVVFDHESIADEFVRNLCGGSKELGRNLLAKLRDIEPFIHAQTQENGLFESLAFENIYGSDDFLRSIFAVFVGIGEADGAVGAEEHRVGVEPEAEVGVTMPVLEIVT